jgi:hypothetical protein
VIVLNSPAHWLRAGAFLLISLHTANAAPGTADQGNTSLPNVIYPLAASPSAASEMPRPPDFVSPEPPPVPVICDYSYPTCDYFWFGGGVLAKRPNEVRPATVTVNSAASLSNKRMAGIVRPRTAHIGGAHRR